MWFRRSRRHATPAPSRAGRIHLVRHGEVDNPDHVVYAGMEGFSLSPLGKRQAADTATRLGELNITGVLSSPLSRATETAAAIAALHAIDVDIDERLTEWSLANRWKGVRWEELPNAFPGELEAYLANPGELPFAPESLEEAARRVEEAVAEFRERSPEGDIVIVGHQDPLQAARLHMTGRNFERFHDGKPEHGSVVTLISSIGSDSSNDPDWIEATYWAPEQGAAFPPMSETPDPRT